MRVPPEAYPILTQLEERLPQLEGADQRALTWWVYGAILAGSACQASVLTALAPVVGRAHGDALRQQLREVFKDGAEHATPRAGDLDVAACFAPLLNWVLAWWRGESLPLALDATALHDRLVVVSVSVLYGGSAIPVAWHVAVANEPGEWLEPAIALLARLAPTVPSTMPTLVLADRGLWSPRIWGAIRALGWHPLLPGPGHAWIGRGVAFRNARARRSATLIATWAEGQAEPWVLLTDLDPGEVGACWYGLRTWIELGFRALKSLGWQWERTRRTELTRVARHWLVLAMATLWVLATGTRDEDAERWGREPAGLRVARTPPPGLFARTTSVFARGLIRLRWQLLRVRRLWNQQWLWPEPLPPPPLNLIVVIHPEPLSV